jgi:hypothetical protein
VLTLVRCAGSVFLTVQNVLNAHSARMFRWFILVLSAEQWIKKLIKFLLVYILFMKTALAIIGAEDTLVRRIDF